MTPAELALTAQFTEPIKDIIYSMAQFLLPKGGFSSIEGYRYIKCAVCTFKLCTLQSTIEESKLIIFLPLPSFATETKFAKPKRILTKVHDFH